MAGGSRQGLLIDGGVFADQPLKHGENDVAFDDPADEVGVDALGFGGVAEEEDSVAVGALDLGFAAGAGTGEECQGDGEGAAQEAGWVSGVRGPLHGGIVYVVMANVQRNPENGRESLESLSMRG